MGTFESMASAADREIVTIRNFNYPRKQVYEAWRNPDLLKTWGAQGDLPIRLTFLILGKVAAGVL